MEIARDTNVEMNLNSSKNHILTVVISGEPSRVAEAKRRVVAELQQQVRGLQAVFYVKLKIVNWFYDKKYLLEGRMVCPHVLNGSQG